MGGLESMHIAIKPCLDDFQRCHLRGHSSIASIRDGHILLFLLRANRGSENKGIGVGRIISVL